MGVGLLKFNMSRKEILPVPSDVCINYHYSQCKREEHNALDRKTASLVLPSGSPTGSQNRQWQSEQ